MTDSEWQEMIQHVRKIAAQVASEYIASAYRKAPREPPSIDSTRQKQIEIIRNALERYRESEPESAIRKMIDHLLYQHAELVDPNDRLYRKRHNILVLKYIVSQPMSDREIKKRLEISDRGFESQLEKGIKEIAAQFFWNWDIWDIWDM